MIFNEVMNNQNIIYRNIYFYFAITQTSFEQLKYWYYNVVFPTKTILKLSG